MARTTRGDSGRDTGSRQTSRRPSTDTTSSRGAASTAGQSANRGGQTRGTPVSGDTKSRTSQAAQPNSTAQSSQGNPAIAQNTQERERTIETRDETPRGASAASGSPATRRGSTSPVYGGSTTPFGSNPFATMRRLSEDMDRLFQAFGFGPVGFGLSPWRDVGSLADQLGTSGNRDAWAPQVETFQRGDSFVVRADLPGLTRDDVRVEIDNDMLTISGERNDEREENRQGFHRSERSYGQFYRAIPLPEGVNADQCDATFKDGVLEVSLQAPKQREKSARQIPIR